MKFKNKISNKRGQAATEMLVLVSFALIFIIPIALLFMSSSNSELGKASITQAKVTARAIADEAGELYLQGANASKIITVNYPDGIQNGSVENGLVVLTIDADGRRLDIVGSTFATIVGNLSGKRTSGLQQIHLETIENSDGYYVNITYVQ